MSDPGGARVSLYEPMQDTKTGEVATGAGAHAVAFNGDGTIAYVSNQMADTVSVIDVGSLSVVATITVGSMPNGLAWREAD